MENIEMDANAAINLANANHDEKVRQEKDSEAMNLGNSNYENETNTIVANVNKTIDTKGKTFKGVRRESKILEQKTGRREFLKLAGAFAIGVMVGKSEIPEVVVKLLQNVPNVPNVPQESAFAKDMQKARGLVKDIVMNDPEFIKTEAFKYSIDEENRFYIESSDINGYNNLINYIVEHSKNSDGEGLSIDQAIFTISLCDHHFIRNGEKIQEYPKNLYESYYKGKSYLEFLKAYFNEHSSEYLNHMQYGLEATTSNEISINYTDGFHNLEEYMKKIQQENERSR